MDRGESEIPPEVGAPMVEVLGGPAEVDCSGGPLLVGAAWVEAPLRVHSEWQGGSSHWGGDDSSTTDSPSNLPPGRSQDHSSDRCC